MFYFHSQCGSTVRTVAMDTAGREGRNNSSQTVQDRAIASPDWDREGVGSNPGVARSDGQ